MKKFVSKKEEQAKKKASIISEHTWSSKLLNAQINKQKALNANGRNSP